MIETLRVPSFKKNLIATAEKIVKQEKQDAIRSGDETIVGWHSDPSIFGRKLALRNVMLGKSPITGRLLVVSACFDIEDEDMDLRVERSRESKPEFYASEYAGYVWQVFDQCLRAHNHENCIGAMTVLGSQPTKLKDRAEHYVPKTPVFTAVPEPSHND